jgi:hypothetical protein
MVYIKAWADFQDQAEALYSASPAKVCTNLCINPCPLSMFFSRILLSHLLASARIHPTHPPHPTLNVYISLSTHRPTGEMWLPLDVPDISLANPVRTSRCQWKTTHTLHPASHITHHTLHPAPCTPYSNPTSPDSHRSQHAHLTDLSSLPSELDTICREIPCGRRQARPQAHR